MKKNCMILENNCTAYHDVLDLKNIYPDVLDLKNI